MQIRILHGYRGSRTKELFLKPGLHDVSDDLAVYLIENGHAALVDENASVREAILADLEKIAREQAVLEQLLLVNGIRKEGLDAIKAGVDAAVTEFTQRMFDKVVVVHSPPTDATDILYTTDGETWTEAEGAEAEAEERASDENLYTVQLEEGAKIGGVSAASVTFNLPANEGDPTNYADLDKDILRALATKRNITVVPTGRNGLAIKPDYVKALKRADGVVDDDE